MDWKRFDNWAEGKPLAMVLFAQQAVASADELHFGLRAIRSSKGLSRLPSPPPIGQWLKLSKSHHRLQNAIGVKVGFEPAGEESASGLQAELRRILRLTPDEQKAEIEAAIGDYPGAFIEKARELGNALFTEHLHQMDLAMSDDVEFDDAEMERWTAIPEYQFFLRVWFPCWMEYRLYPPELYRLARNGNMDALEDLLRLDKSVIYDRHIAEQFHQAYHSAGRVRYRIITSALSGVPRGTVNPRKVKCALAGMISEVSKRIGNPLTEPEIRELFDAYAKAQGKLRDTDLPESSETFAKAIQRERPKWWMLLRSDKNHP